MDTSVVGLAPRTKEGDQARRERLARAPVEEIENIPAENAVDRSRLVPQARLERLDQTARRSAALRLRVNFCDEVLDENLAGELVAEKRDVLSDDGP